MDTHTPEAYYNQRINNLDAEMQSLLRKKNQLAWLRFISVIAAFVAAKLVWPYSVAFAIIAFLLLTGLFIYFLVKDLTNRQAIEHTSRLLHINKTELNVLHHNYLHLPDGEEFADPAHSYANDLDIFGRASLFQYINRTTAEQSAAELASLLKQPCEEKEILLRQQAAKELAEMHIFRQQLQAFGAAEPITIAAEEKINNWLTEESDFTKQTAWKAARIFLPLISFTLLLLYLTGVLPGNSFTPAIILMMIIAYGISKKTGPAHSHLSRIAPQLNSLSNSVRLIEQTSFAASFLQQIKERFAHEPHTASAEIKSLTRILERLDYKLNFIVHIPLNTFLFWDLQQLFALENWKRRNRRQISNWFQGLAMMEAATTTGTLTFNHRAWVFPVITSKEGVFESTDLGHPLISPQKRVSSSFSTSGVAKMNLITGSNMAGKSTFLRSVGINIVLAMAGCPVCAGSLTLSYMKVMSSMRISDNLEESTSTFYAELKKLKEIIDAVNRKEKVFLLLDEILRGTNSADRHTGSKALVIQLIHHQATGVLATHDLELAKLADEFPGNIRNYHFDVQVVGNELFFDYKLKEGVCQSMNASLLMKKIGIEL